MRKSIYKYMLAFILFYIISSFGTQALAAPLNDKFDIKISVGFNDSYKIGFSTPVNISIKNKYKNITGEVEIQVPTNSGKYLSYVKSLSLQKDAEKVITINVPVGMNMTKYALNIYDSSNKVYQDTIEIGMSSNNVIKFIGIMSDDFDSLSYINTAPASTGISIASKVIKLNEKNFPEDIFVLNAFDILVINNYDTSRFSKQQYEILKQWVGNGGTLLIGTGSKYSKTLSVFKDDFIQGTEGSLSEIATSKIYDMATNGDNKNETRLDALSLNIKEGNVLMEDKNVKLVQSLIKGRGVVGILAFDLGQAPFVNWNNNTAFAEKLLGIVNPELTAYKNNTNSIINNMYMIKNLMNQFSEMDMAKTSSFYLILFIYVFAVAPFSYFILKKMDKRELMWITVPVLAVVFGLMIYITGAGTRLSKITTNMVSIINMDEKGNAAATNYAGIFNANKMKVDVEGKNGEKLFPLSNDNFYNNSKQTSKNEIMEARIIADGNGGVEYRNSSLLETKVLQVQDTTRITGKIETNITLLNGELVGSIRNLTNLDLYDCLIVMPARYYKIDSLKAGETAEIDGKAMKSYTGNMQMMFDNVYYTNSSYTTNISGDERKRRMDRMQEGNILQMASDNGNGTGQIEGIKFVGFSKTQIHNPLIVNKSEAKKNERNVLIIPLQLKFTNGDTIEYPLGCVPFDVINASSVNYDVNAGRFFGNGYAELMYRIDKAMKVDEIKIDTLNTAIKNSSQGLVYYIFDMDKNSYEPINGKIIKGDDLKKYVAGDNTVKIKLEVSNTDGIVPQMAAKGRKK